MTIKNITLMTIKKNITHNDTKQALIHDSLYTKAKSCMRRASSIILANERWRMSGDNKKHNADDNKKT